MPDKIVTKFTIGNRDGFDALLFISTAIAKEKFAGKIDDQGLQVYINRNFNESELLKELNSLSNQYLIVYVNDEPAGYAKVTSKGTRPTIFEGKTLARIADFGVLEKHNDPLIRKALFEKCLAISTAQQAVWISEYENSPHLDFFESYGFKRNTDIIAPKELPLPPVYLVKEKI
ncbi:N-acetyltransferase [Mucilaginibacter endophyticus]|uniref:N-acetyltransferase n=1 Tax=Mucilaginibacter endophyticus TaxID=2675003 RepID=UPI000E0DC143|nr:N-acetyltransferase [Mucilaginibacter endophyticus]